MTKKIAHRLSNEIWRSGDIKFDDTLFADFNLNQQLLSGLQKSGFQKPSEIQLKSIPYGRLGLDLFVQSKSGTGKTCVFTVIVLDTVDLSVNCCQCLILVPTREIASQTHEVFRSLGQCMKGLSVRKFIGGNDLKKDIDGAKNCHVAIGTPGRVKYLIDENHLKTNAIRTLVLDEADKLFDENFTEQINQISVQLPSPRQTILVSATATDTLFAYIRENMTDARHIKIDYERLCLVGVDQYYCDLGFLPNEHLEDALLEKLLIILRSVSFGQCIIFSNSETRTTAFRQKLINNGWSTELISGRFQQKVRDKVLKSMKNFEFKILLSTDLIARGIDCEHVNLVINLDVPVDMETYLHRVGRCGRFGQHGIAITICSRLGGYHGTFGTIKEQLGDDLVELPDLTELEMDLWDFKKTKPDRIRPLTLEDLSRPPQLNPSKYLSLSQLIDDYDAYSRNFVTA